MEALPCTPAYIAKEQAQFLTGIQDTYEEDLARNLPFELDGTTYGPYEENPLTEPRYGANLSPAGWAGCAPPLVCVHDCEAARPVEPLPAYVVNEGHICRLHEEYLIAGQSNRDTFRC